MQLSGELWFAVRVIAGREFAIADHLRIIGVHHFLPVEQVRVRCGLRKAPVLRTRVLLPGWLMVCFNWDSLRFDVVSGIAGVLGFAGFERPERIRASVMAEFMADRDCWMGAEAAALSRARRDVERQLLEERRALLEPGLVADVPVGAFGDVAVRIVSIDGDKARCVSHLFGAEREVSVGLDALADGLRS